MSGFWRSFLGLLLAGGLAACAGRTPTTPPPAELVLFIWADYMPPDVLAAFTAETGTEVRLITYESAEAALAAIRAGQVYDVAVVDNEQLPALVQAGRLAEINLSRVPNFKNISANFRDLATDPGNRYSIPYNWGATGVVVRTDRLPAPITTWADLWDPRLAGRVMARAQTVELLSVALKSLGQPLDTADPAALEAALARLRSLRPNLLQIAEVADVVQVFLDSSAVCLIGWSEDALLAQAQDPAVDYVLPADGALLWGDSFIISVDSLHRAMAEQFINFVLRPEMSVQVVETYHYATANEAALTLVDPLLLNNPVIFPPRADLERAEWYPPLSPAAEQLFDQTWRRFLDERP